MVGTPTIDSKETVTGFLRHRKSRFRSVSQTTIKSLGRFPTCRDLEQKEVEYTYGLEWDCEDYGVDTIVSTTEVYRPTRLGPTFQDCKHKSLYM